MDLLELLQNWREAVFLLIPVAFAVLIQIVKVLFANRGKKFKNPDTWLWIVFALGFFMSWIYFSIQGYEDFTAGGFILISVVMSAVAAYAYKFTKVGGKTVKSIFGRKKGAGDG